MSQLQLLKQKRFGPLFWTQFFGALNDNLLKNALVILIAFKTTQLLGIPSAEMVSVAGGIFILPFFLFSATAGQLADKFEKGKLIRIIKGTEIAIMALATYGFISHHYSFLLIVLFLMGLHSTFFGPLKFSILPQHLSERELVGGNALIEAGTFLAILLGTILGGVMIAWSDDGTAYVSAALMLIAILGLVASFYIPTASAVDPTLRVQWNPITPTWSILKQTKKNRTVFLSILGISWFWFFGAAILSLFPSYCKDVLKTDESVVTLFLACFSIGIGIGSILCEKLSRRSLELGLVPLGSIGISVFALDLFFSGRPSAFATPLPIGIEALAFLQTREGFHIVIDLLGLSMFSGLFIVPMNALVQERSEVSHRSRTIAGNNIVNAFFMVLSSGMLVGLMKIGFTIPQIFLTLAVMNGHVAAYIYTMLPEFLLRFLAWIVANLMYRLKIEGGENIPEKGPVLVVCNHVSFIDWLIIGAAIPRPARFVMHYSFYKGWLPRRLMTRAKVIPIAGFKENPEILASAFEKMADELAHGQVVCVFPEGAITRDGNLSIFRPGVEKVLKIIPVPVVPMGLNGMWGSFFSRKGGAAMSKPPARFWSRVTLKIGKSLPPEEVTAARLQTLVGSLLQ